MKRWAISEDRGGKDGGSGLKSPEGSEWMPGLSDELAHYFVSTQSKKVGCDYESLAYPQRWSRQGGWCEAWEQRPTKSRK